jgi:hypothetical protein
MRLLTLACAALLVSACESGMTRSLKLTIPNGVAQPFTATAPGIVVTDMGGNCAPYFVLCGQKVADPVTLTQDLGFGCLGSRDGTSETLRSWVQAMPTSWDAAATCAAQRERPFYEALSIGPDDAGVSDRLAETPEASWPQGSATGTWRRDLSPCGGVLNVELTLAVP